MTEFLNITPKNHDETIRKVQGKLYILYFSLDCAFCRQAIRDLLDMPDNSLFTYAVCRLDDDKDFRLKENILSMPTVRIYENGVIIRESGGYNEAYGASYEVRKSFEREKDYRIVYADNAATTKMSRKALKAFTDAAKNDYGNPSSGYDIGLSAKGRMGYARNLIRYRLGFKSGRIIFTGSGSEADNLALFSAYKEGIKLNKKHMITSATEHHAVLHTMEKFKEDGFEISVLGVNDKGRIDINELKKSIRPETVLVSIMYANNETGTIQPVEEIGKLCKENGVLFHCDAIQAVGHIKIDLSKLDIDYLSMAAHKFNGPKGVGALLTSKKAPLYPMIFGGGQELSYRAGTENVPGIYSMAIALDDNIRHIRRNTKKTKELMERLISGLSDIPGVIFNGDMENRLPGTINVSLENISGRELLFLLDAKYGICVSGGSACNTGSKEPSHVLLAMGIKKELADSSIRISLNSDNNIEEVDYIIKAIKDIINPMVGRKKVRGI